MDAVDIFAVESKLTDVTVTPIPMITNHNSKSTSNILNIPPSPHSPLVVTTHTSANITTPLTSVNHMQASNNSALTKYAQLLLVIEEMGRDIRPTYSGSRSSAERLKRGIVHARILVRECLLETERSARQ